MWDEVCRIPRHREPRADNPSVPELRIPPNTPGVAGPGAALPANAAAPVDAVPERAAAGLDAASNAHPTVRSGPVRQPGAPAGVPPQLRVRPAAVFELTDQAQGAVGLPTVLKAVTSRVGQKAVAEHLAAELAKMGLPLPEAVVAKAARDPAKLLDALTVTPRDMANGIEAMAAAQQAGALPPGEPRKRLLPQKFDLGQLDQVAIERPAVTLKRLAPGLYRGTLPSDLPDAQARRNTVFAEILDRLADNTGVASRKDKFQVTVDGKNYSRVDTFLGALVKRGWTVDVTCAHRIANFTELKAKPEGAPDTAAVDVPAGIMVRTGVRDAQGREAVIPATHAELRIHLAKPGDAPVEADVKFYQGVPHTGFFPMGLSQEPKWTGSKTVALDNGDAKVSGRKAVDLLTNAGLLGDLIKDVAKDLNLPMSGYGLTGVCMDSVQVLWTLAGGPLTYYPLMMRDGLLFGELDRRLNDGDKGDDRRYTALREAIARVPADVDPQPDRAKRALASLPWAAGEEPFVSSRDARQILEGAIAG
jgi:hypothetical protein